MKYLGLLSLLLFFISRLPFLNLPLFWDELGVYGASIFYMVDNVVSPLPSALPAWLSRGHPMLYVWANSLWASLFGSNLNVTAMHLFNLGIALTLAASTWRIGFKLGGHRFGLLAMLLLLVQPIFRSQSNLVLPEISLALAVLWMVYACHQKQWLQYFLAGACAIWIKETAVIVPAALGISCLVLESLRSNKLRFPLAQLLLIASPYLAFLLFLQLNYSTHGWYFFPYHTDGFNFSPGYMTTMFMHYLDFLFWEQGRFLLPLVLLAFLAMRFSKGRGDLYNLFLKNQFELRAGITILSLLLFSSSNYYMNRYTLLLLPLICLLFARFLLYVHAGLSGNNKRLWTGFAALVLFMPLAAGVALSRQGFAYGENDGYRSHVLQLKETVFKIEQQLPQGTRVFSNFPLQLALKDHRYGYFKDEHLNVLDAPDSSCTILIVSPGDPSHGIPIFDSTRYFQIDMTQNQTQLKPLK